MQNCLMATDINRLQDFFGQPADKELSLQKLKVLLSCAIMAQLSLTVPLSDLNYLLFFFILFFNSMNLLHFNVYFPN